MVDNSDFETFLFVSEKKLIILVNNSQNKKIYEEEEILKKENKELIFKEIDFFLEKNIYKIEKKIQSFVKQLHLILDLEEFFSIEISIKNKDFQNVINFESLSYTLNEAREYCKETIDDKKIVHMLVDNYTLDDKKYSSLPKNLKCNNFSLDIRFICISKQLVKNLEKIFKKYQISLGQIFSFNYVEKFLLEDRKNIFLAAKMLMNGLNPNEVIFTNKSVKNQGFFEKFFNLFS